MFPHLTLCPYRDICMRYCATNITKAERRDKSKNKVFQDLAMPRRILSKTKSKIEAGRRGKSKTQFSDLTFPRRILSKTKSKIEAGRRDKSKTQFSELTLPRRILSK